MMFSLSNKRHYKKIKFLNTKSVFRFCLQILPEKFLVMKTIQRNTVTTITVQRSAFKVPFIPVRF